MRKGYYFENLFTKQIEEQNAEVFKLSLGTLGADFLVYFYDTKSWALYEVKSAEYPRKYFQPRERKQLTKIEEVAKKIGIPAYLWVYWYEKRMKVKRVVMVEEYVIWHPEEKVVKSYKDYMEGNTLKVKI